MFLLSVGFCIHLITFIKGTHNTSYSLKPPTDLNGTGLSYNVSVGNTVCSFQNATKLSLRNFIILIWAGTTVVGTGKVTDLDQRDITVPHAVDQ
jgi:hypothetical protein